jgi:hypothetical protein
MRAPKQLAPSRTWQAVLTAALALSLASTATPKAAAADSGMRSNKAAIALVATLPAQLQLSLSDIHLDINVADPTRNSAIVTTSVTSSWVLGSAASNVELVGFFDSPEAAVSDSSGHMVPASHLLGGIAGGEMRAFSETSRVGTANASRMFFRQPLSRTNSSASRTDTLNIQLSRIDDLGAPAGEYRGVLHLRLVAY